MPFKGEVVPFIKCRVLSRARGSSRVPSWWRAAGRQKVEGAGEQRLEGAGEQGWEHAVDATATFRNGGRLLWLTR